MKKNKSRSDLKFFGLPKLKPYVRPYGKIFASLVIFAFIGSLFDIVLPLFQKYAIDNFIAHKTTEGLVWFITVYALFIVIQTFCNSLSLYNCCQIEMYVGRDMKRVAFNHLQQLSVSYYNTHSVGSIHSRVMSDTNRIASALSWNLFDSLWNVCYLIGSIVLMFILNPLLALCVTVIVPIVGIVAVYFRKRLTVLHREVRETNSMITGSINEGVTGTVTTKSLTAEEETERQFEKLAENMRVKSVALGRRRAMLSSIVMFASFLALALVLWYGGVITMKGVFMIGTLSVFMTYARGLMEPVQWLIGIFSQLINVKVNIERFTALTETESDVKDTKEVIEKYGDVFNPKKENWEKVHGDIVFDDVTFKYPDGDEYVLEHFNLTVNRGTTVAIVGETGAGKSTLVNLVCRFFEPTEGRILLDGKDLRERSVSWLHSNIGYVLQTPHLFSGTIRENLLYGNPQATDDDLDRVVKEVNAEAVIARLENGYDTVIGEGGNSLSTGEKQLLSFARAILSNPAIFVLDEATASIDTLTEQLIQDAINKLMQGRTNFVIAHRLSTIRNADIILVVNNGKITESGTHDELLKKHGEYYNLYVRQFREEQVSAFNDKN